MREKPKQRAIYVWAEISNSVEPFSAGILATAVPVNAKNRNMVVPTNSPSAATMSIKYHVLAKTWIERDFRNW